MPSSTSLMSVRVPCLTMICLSSDCIGPPPTSIVLLCAGRSFERLLFYVEEAHWYYEARLVSPTLATTVTGQVLRHAHTCPLWCNTALSLCSVGTVCRCSASIALTSPHLVNLHADRISSFVTWLCRARC